MDSLNLRRKFTPLDLQTLDHVFALACFHIEASNLDRTAEVIDAEKEALRGRMFDLAITGPVNFDTLSEKVLASIGTAFLPSTRSVLPRDGEARLRLNDADGLMP